MILGNTKVNIVGCSGLNNKEKQILNLLYGPLMHPLSFKFYELCLVLNDLVIPCDYDFLSQLLGCSIDELETARINNEKLGLIKTYHYNNQHQIELIKPKSVNQFVHHDLLARLYIQESSVGQLKMVSAMIKENQFIADMQEITSNISLSELESYNQEQENQYQQELNTYKSNGFDIELFLSSANEVMFPKSVRTQENIELISELASKYQLTLEQVLIYVAQSMNKKNDKLYVNKLKEYASNQLIEIKSKDPNPLNWSTPEFLQSKMGDVPVLDTTLNTIKFIQDKYQFSDQVINVLIDYSLNNNKGILARRYLDTIASAMHLNKVKTLQDAINHFAFDKKKKTSKQSEPIIKYKDYNDMVVESDNKEEDLENILKELKSWK